MREDGSVQYLEYTEPFVPTWKLVSGVLNINYSTVAVIC